ncbi:nitroreductase family deazaflavin-dependent oxidoreductase [Microbacterium sp. C7(2022)]|nr:nitroreductase family deazaflavin-dependent oxidoreductase [Microbacterium sp. C7(2022)]
MTDFAARMLRVRWLVRAPIALYRAGLGWMLGSRFVMIEHQGRSTGEARFVVVEVIDRDRNAIRVASGFGTHAQWYRNLQANGVAYLSTGRARRVKAGVNLLDEAESRAVLARYAAAHPDAWATLEPVMGELSEESYPSVVEFVPPEGWRSRA